MRTSSETGESTPNLPNRWSRLHVLFTQKRIRYRARQYRLRSRRIHDRSLPFPFPMGVVPLHQVSGKTANPIGFTWKYSYLHPYLRRKASWCPCSWHSPSWARSFLHYGSWICWLHATLYSESSWSILCDPGQAKHAVYATIFANSWQIERSQMRPDNLTNRDR